MPLPEPPVVIEFRDGERSVPAHVVANMNLAGLDPITVTYEEAVRLSDQAVLRNFLNETTATMIRRHFVDNR